jgi:hypothetical protein
VLTSKGKTGPISNVIGVTACARRILVKSEKIAQELKAKTAKVLILEVHESIKSKFGFHLIQTIYRN